MLVKKNSVRVPRSVRLWAAASALAVAAALPATATVKTVTVGYHPAAGLMHGAKDGEPKSGYAYDYIQEMSTHTGWRYRYVYGGFNELYEKLKTGEIDLLPFVTRTARRERDVAFPDRAMGENRLYLAAVKPEKTGDGLKDLQGRRIGLLRGAYSSDVLRKLLAENGVVCAFTEYGMADERIAALKRGEIDFTLETGLAGHRGDLRIVREVDAPHHVYFAVSKKRPDLLAELNAAQKESEELNPGFLGGLRWKHFKGTTVHREIGEAARAWFAAHRTLRLGTYTGDDFWVRKTADGSFTGVLPDYVGSLLKALDLKVAVEWKFYPGRDEALKALAADEIDLLNPYYCSYGDAERDGVLISDRAFKCGFSVLHVGAYTHETMAVVATPSARLGARYVRDNYPKAKIVPCRTGADCIAKLIAGEANCVVMNSEGLRRVAGRVDEDFNVRPLNADCPIAFAAMPCNAVLVSVVNRAIPLLSDVEVNALFDKYGADDSTRISMRQFLARRPEYVYLGAAVALAVFLLVAIVLLQRKLRLKMAEHTAFANYFLNTFVSSYYVDLATRAFKPYAREKRIARDYPVVPDYVESLKVYAEREVHPEDRRALLEFIRPENLKRLLKERPVVAHSFRVSEAGDEKVLGLRVVRGEDENSAAFAFADVTDETRREQEHQRQLAITEARTKFFFNVSHDVRTPVHAIMGLVDMCLDDVKGEGHGEKPADGELIRRLKDRLLKMKASGGLLLSIIKSVLDMSRIEAGKVKIEESYGDVYLSFLEIEPTLRELAQEKNIHLDFDFGEIRDRYVCGDYEKCSRVFVNIIANAIKYTPEGGWVRVTCEQIGKVKSKGEKVKSEVGDSSSEREEENSALFHLSPLLSTSGSVAVYRYTFQDNGIGMSEEFQKKLYEKFSREKNSTMSGVSGLGLGMAIVKSFVDILGGTIECRSKKNEGTTFTVTLPFRVQEGRKWTDPITGAVRDKDEERGAGKVKSKGEKVKSEVEDSGSGKENGDSALFHLSPSLFTSKRVLLVDDSKLNREVACYYLQKAGFEVDVAANGREAVEKVKSKGERVKSEVGDSLSNTTTTTSNCYYDLILMDMQMPVMDGIEATRAIRAWEAERKVKSKGERVKSAEVDSGSEREREDSALFHPSPLLFTSSRPRLPIIAWTANAFDEDVKRALDAGMDGHVAKGVKSAVLLETLRKFLNPAE